MSGLKRRGASLGDGAQTSFYPIALWRIARLFGDRVADTGQIICCCSHMQAEATPVGTCTGCRT